VRSAENFHRPVLLVDDNAMDVELTQVAFRKLAVSNELLVARDGDEALSWAPRWAAGEITPLVILLDLNMPRVSGFDVLAKLKNDESTRAIPIVVLTSSALDSDVRKAYKLGANAYLQKPVDFTDFQSMLDTLKCFWRDRNIRAD
jgi:CheY-like chemotaxis protein